MGWNRRYDVGGGWWVWDRGELGEGVRLEHENGQVIELSRALFMAYALPDIARGAVLKIVEGCCIGADMPIPRWPNEINVTLDIDLSTDLSTGKGARMGPDGNK